MSIIIHGMDMPETCCKCKMMVYVSEKVWDNNGTETVGAWVCLLTGELADDTKREEHCPLTELPPHGRLIDADVFEKENIYYWGRDFIGAKDETCLCELIEAAPTIIEAEEVKE